MNKCCIVCAKDIRETMSNVCSLKCYDEWVSLNLQSFAKIDSDKVK